VQLLFPLISMLRNKQDSKEFWVSLQLLYQNYEQVYALSNHQSSQHISYNLSDFLERMCSTYPILFELTCPPLSATSGAGRRGRLIYFFKPSLSVIRTLSPNPFVRSRQASCVRARYDTCIQE